ncbi:DUF7093 family protein [Halobaculum limi]|uniref:DUF7093 family protein n=1 Tax=Halobaculum limi TaxID=3031916 RepID=UPI002404F029|nr:hypothetical protein [Halobaculum sp. YSMS11]
MGLRCLLGHDFSEPRTETDREERGDEVITTITEVKECARCGETRVVSENKEVTSLDRSGVSSDPAQREEGGDVPFGTSESADATDTVAPAVTDATDVGDDVGAEVMDADSTDGASPDTAAADVEGAEAATDAAAPSDDDFDHPTADPDEAATDAEEDAEIIDGEGATTDSADGEPTGRAHGEWPDADANRKAEDEPTGQTDWPDADAPAGDHDGDDPTEPRAPVDEEAEDVEILDDDPDPESAAATEARTDVVADATNADEAGVASDPADEDVEFIDGDGPSDWPEQDGDDEGYDAEVDDGSDAGVSVDGNLRPQVDADVASEEDVEFIEADADAASTPSGHERATGTESATSADAAPSDATESTASSGRPTVELQTTVDRVETVYVCPDCGLREPVGASSMRAGDICPDCKRGYIEERELE